MSTSIYILTTNGLVTFHLMKDDVEFYQCGIKVKPRAVLKVDSNVSLRTSRGRPLDDECSEMLRTVIFDTSSSHPSLLV